MKSNTKALINYYARLIKKDVYKVEDVPANLRDDVVNAVSALMESESDNSEQKE